MPTEVSKSTSSDDNSFESELRRKSKELIDEVIVNPTITKKGFLNFLEEKSIGWVKKYVVIIIYLFIL